MREASQEARMARGRIQEVVVNCLLELHRSPWHKNDHRGEEVFEI